MEFDTERADEKRRELIELAQQALSPTGDQSVARSSQLDYRAAAEALVERFIVVTPPEKAPLLIHMVTMNSGGVGGGTSVKPGNLHLSLRKLTDAIASGVLTFVGVTSSPWLLLLAAIVVWNRLWSELTIEVSEHDAAVLWTLWKHRDKKNYVSVPNLLEAVNTELCGHSRDPLTALQLGASLATLQKIACIEKSDAQPSSWWLREWVSVRYR